MAALSLGSCLTLTEMVRREDPKGRLADIVDVLSQRNNFFRDAIQEECNDGTSMSITRKATEPSGSERAYNQGVTPEAGVTEQVVEPTCMFCGLSEVDVALMEDSPDGPGPARAQEDGFFLAGLAKQVVSRCFDGNRSTSPMQVNGINNRSDYNALSSDFVYDNAGGNASATANKTSIYLIKWGKKRVTMDYPRNYKPGKKDFGIKMVDYGRQIITDAVVTTKKYPAYQTWFEIRFGLCIHDPRCIRRICNISTSNIDGIDDFSVNEDYLIDAITDMPDGIEGVIAYCNKVVFAQLWKRANSKGNASFTAREEGEGPFARRVVEFGGVDFHLVEQITSTQSTVS